MTAAGAIRLARRLEPYDPLWFEEPVPPDAPEEMARVARATRIPIAAGERLCTKYDFARTAARGCCGDSADEPRARRRNPGGEENCRARRSAARTARAAPVLRAGGGGRQHPALHLQPELPDPRGDRALAGFSCRGAGEADPLGGGLCDSTHRARARRRAQRGGHRQRTPTAASSCTWRWPASRSLRRRGRKPARHSCSGGSGKWCTRATTAAVRRAGALRTRCGRAAPCIRWRRSDRARKRGWMPRAASPRRTPRPGRWWHSRRW